MTDNLQADRVGLLTAGKTILAVQGMMDFTVEKWNILEEEVRVEG